MQSNDEKFSKHIEELSDSSWLLDLAFLADITEKLNILNLDLQGKDKDLAQMMGSGSNDGICESFQSQTDIMDVSDEIKIPATNIIVLKVAQEHPPSIEWTQKTQQMTLESESQEEEGHHPLGHQVEGIQSVWQHAPSAYSTSLP
ncbi:hypothetical protein J437_LFUL008245 [Ladona fulva]|uniref:Uncharacterized protein n=1 Tax=Ladona fulva TaxID=123851 RepID=A0A8K0K8P1_LADFU|nr:hypothetical protein J437_LFUL008245 [Ladona fulva]